IGRALAASWQRIPTQSSFSRNRETARMPRTLAAHFQLLFDFTRRQQMVSIPPFNVISLAKLERFVSRCRRPLIFLTNHGYFFAGKLSRHGKGLIARSIVDDDNFF